MPQNRKKLIDLFIGSISVAIVHEMLIIAAENEEVKSHYKKEIKNLLVRSKRYRNKINPISVTLQEKDINYIKNKIINKVKTELKERISEGYKNINLNLIEGLVHQHLRETKIS